VHENRQQILAQEQKKPESSLAKKIPGFQNERAAKIGLPNDTVKEEICRIARLDRSDHRARPRERARWWPSAARSSSANRRKQG
jgi:hypothetical protein